MGYLQDAISKGNLNRVVYNLGLNLSIKPMNGLLLMLPMHCPRFVGPSGGAGAITGESVIINQFQRSLRNTGLLF